MPDHDMNYIESDAPMGMTLTEWRRARVAPTSRRRLRLRILPVHPRPAFAI